MRAAARMLLFLLAVTAYGQLLTTNPSGGGGTAAVLTEVTGSIVHSGIGYPAAPAIVSGFTSGTSAYYWCVAEDANGRQTTSSTAGTGTTATTGTMSCGGDEGAVKYYLLRTAADVNPGGPPADTLIGSCTAASGGSCTVADAATSPTEFQANTSDMTAVIDDGSFPPKRESLGRIHMVGGLDHKAVSVEADATHTAADLTGQGAVTHIWLASLNFSGCLITITRDGEGTPSVNEVPCLRFFGAVGQTGTPGLTAPFIGNTIGMSPVHRLQIFIPFESSLVIGLKNSGGVTATVWVQTSVVYTKRDWGIYSHLHVDQVDPSVAAYAEATVLDVDGPGVLLGQAWTSQGGDGNLQYMEGPVNIYYDNNTSPSYESSGYEDHFNFSGYFQQCSTTVSIAMDEFGCNNVAAGTSFSEAYRFFLTEPVYFNSHLKVTAFNGVDGIGFTVTNSTQYFVTSFYYTAD